MLPGKSIQINRWIHGRLCVVCVKVDAIIPDADPSQPYLEPATIKRLDEIQAKADAGDVGWLERVGQVYVRKSA